MTTVIEQQGGSHMNELIKRIRLDRGLSQQEFAQEIGVTQSMLSMLESGEREPGRKTLVGLLTIASAEHEAQLLRALKGNGSNGDAS